MTREMYWPGDRLNGNCINPFYFGQSLCRLVMEFTNESSTTRVVQKDPLTLQYLMEPVWWLRALCLDGKDETITTPDNSPTARNGPTASKQRCSSKNSSLLSGFSSRGRFLIYKRVHYSRILLFLSLCFIPLFVWLEVSWINVDRRESGFDCAWTKPFLEVDLSSKGVPSAAAAAGLSRFVRRILVYSRSPDQKFMQDTWALHTISGWTKQQHKIIH